MKDLDITLEILSKIGKGLWMFTVSILVMVLLVTGLGWLIAIATPQIE